AARRAVADSPDARSLLAGGTGADVRRFLEELDLTPGPTSLGGVTPLPPPAPGRDVPALLDGLLPSGRDRPRYTPTKLHATGGIGQAWLARDTALAPDGALKEPR